MNRKHAMPFGAEVRGDGVRFRLWAPAARRVDLVISQTIKPLKAVGGGWFELFDADSAAGTLYRYRIDEGPLVPDPASRFQPQDVDGPSEVIDPARHAWKDAGWRNRPWQEAVIYELHVGTFTPEGTYAAVARKLNELRDVGVTAIELMPLADF
ncbi:MAG TPA: malto-oligosyltrehalose trehalohydrolase, partial [Burkholderiales bacterium]